MHLSVLRLCHKGHQFLSDEVLGSFPSGLPRTSSGGSPLTAGPWQRWGEVLYQHVLASFRSLTEPEDASKHFLRSCFLSFIFLSIQACHCVMLQTVTLTGGSLICQTSCLGKYHNLRVNETEMRQPYTCSDECSCCWEARERQSLEKALGTYNTLILIPLDKL